LRRALAAVVEMLAEGDQAIVMLKPGSRYANLAVAGLLKCSD